MKNYLTFAVLLSCGFGLVAPAPARSAVVSKAVTETIEYVSKSFAKETAQEGTEVMAKKIEQFAAKHGDESLEAVKRFGPSAMKVADDAGANGATALRAMTRFGDDGVVWIAKRPEGLELAAKYGDEAAEALVKHKGIAEPLIRGGGESAARALKAVDPQHARLMTSMLEEPASKALMSNSKLLDVIAKYGDNAVNYIWRNKGKLAVAAALAAFLADPQPFLDGARELSQAAVVPIGQAGGDAVRSVNWTLIMVLVVLIAGGIIGGKFYLRHRAQLKSRTA